MKNEPHSCYELRKWSKLARRWINYLPPIRPSVEDLQVFRNLILSCFTDRTEITAMVLGATPELRDLLYELGASVTVVDQNPKMVEEMNRLRVYESCEILHIDDWFQFLPYHRKSFNLIVSDLTQGNIPYTEQDQFYQLVSDALVPNGVFIDRVFTYRNFSKLYVAAEEFKQFSEVPAINLVSLNEMLYKCFLASNLLSELGKADFSEFYSIVREEYTHPVLHRYITLMSQFLVPEGTIWYCGKSWEQISQVYFRYLRLFAEIPSREVIYRGVPFILASTPK